MTEHLFYPDSSALINAFPEVKIERKLGEGGQKYVYKAKTEQEGTVAFKIIKTNQQLERTIREINAASSFCPPRFPKIYRYGHSNVGDIEVVFIVEEFIEGISLRERINQGAVPEQEALKIGFELLLALCEISNKNLVHRDIKPENIMLRNSGEVVLLDFGIARHLELNSLTHDLAMFGPLTPGYAAPEQINNEKRSISPRADLFAWGIVMYEMISGSNPFTQSCSTGNEALIRTLNFTPGRLESCSSELSKVIDWCMKKPVHRRPPSPAFVLEYMQRGLL